MHITYGLTTLGGIMAIDGIWLASASKRRLILLKEIISKNGYDVELASKSLVKEEQKPSYSTLKENVYSITRMKLENAIAEISLGRLEQLNFNKSRNILTNKISIVSDTLVEDPDSFSQIFGKASDKLEALSMLKRLSGRRHNVWTSTGLIIHKSIKNNFKQIPDITSGEWLGFIWTDYSTVEIEELSDDILIDLINSNSWVGKAGAYDLDGKMSEFAKVIKGEKITVLGFSSKAIINLEDFLKIK